jgi:hypothetical protein
MNIRILAAAAATASLLTACGSTTTSTPTSTASTSTSGSPSAVATSTPATAGLTLSPAGFGPVKLGMTKAEAAATGVFNVDVKNANCEGSTALVPKAPYTSSFDVLLDKSGRITAIGGQGANLKTSLGIRAGSTLADVQKAYPSASAPRDPGGDAGPYHQSAVYVHEGENYLGFLFQTTPAKIQPTDTVTFMEISHGRPPSLFRDAC